MSASERLPASCAGASGEHRYIALSHEHVGCVVAYSRYGDSPVVVAHIVPDGTTVSVSLPAGGRWRYAGAMIPEKDGVIWPYSGCGRDKFLTPLTEEPVLDDCFSSFEVYADDKWDNLLDDTPYFIVRSHVDRLIAAGVPVTVLPADQAVSRSGQLVDSCALDLVNRALDALDIKYTSLPLNLRKYITYRDFTKLTLDLYEAMSGEEAPEASYEDGPFSERDGSYWQAGIRSIFGGNALFGPDELLTREQAAVVLAHVYCVKLGGFEKLGWTSLPAVSRTVFADDRAVSGCAKSAVAFMAEKGIVNGLDGNRFDPKGNVRCEEALVMALRMFETLK